MLKNKIIIVLASIVLLYLLGVYWEPIISFLEYAFDGVSENIIPISIAYATLWVIRNRVQDKKL